MTTTQQLQQDIQNELYIANQMLRLISLELQQIKQLTKRGGEFETNVLESDTLVKTLADMQKISLENLAPIVRTQIDLTNNDHNMSHEQARDDSMEDNSE